MSNLRTRSHRKRSADVATVGTKDCRSQRYARKSLEMERRIGLNDWLTSRLQLCESVLGRTWCDGNAHIQLLSARDKREHTASRIYAAGTLKMP
jgi:hypothetical protein